MAAWISEQEASHGFVLYEADAGPSTSSTSSAWTRRCLRQADRILVVAGADGEPSLGDLGPELAVLEAEQGRQLEEVVLLHRDGSRRPRGTAEWLRLRPFVGHHHVRLDRPGDLDRLARFLAGRAVGLVLGGGGARGFAHIGVIRALEESGVPIDRIGGTSMGAVVAAQYARGGGWQDLLKVNRRGWVEMAPHKVYTLPLISLLSAIKAEKMLDMMYADDRIEDLWTSFFCVSTNLSRTELMIHRDGPLRDGVSASMTLPGVTPPVVTTGGDLLVDGGVLNNLPTDVMRQLGPGPIIAVDVSATLDVRADPSYSKTPTPWQLLGNRLRPRAEPRPFPNILRLIHRAALMASDVYAKQAKQEVELYLDLPMDHFDMFDMDALDRIAEFGYRFAREQLDTTAALAAIGWAPSSPAATPGTE
jgi:NTE family protein/lysophospholipid hydrolase